MTTFSEKYGPWALITGASSGLGTEFARQLAPKGMNLVLTARRKDRLDALAADLEAAHNIQTKCVRADLSTENFMAEIEPVTTGLEIGMLINNAGFGVTGYFLDNPLGRELEQLHVNCRAPLILTHHFAGPMVERGRGGIIFVSSLAGFMAAPHWLGYSSSKAYDLYIANSLWGELRDKGVDVQALCPGATHTEFGKVAGVNSRLGSMQPEPVIAESLRKLGKKTTVYPGLRSKLSYAALRVMPRKLVTIVARKAIGQMKSG